MKKRKIYAALLTGLILALIPLVGCTESIMDDINKNTASPPVSDVDARFQLTDAIMSIFFTTYGGAYAWHVASYTEQIFGDGGTQMMYAELRDPIVTAAPTTFNNEWNNTYHNLLNLNIIIDKCTNGVNAGQTDLRGIARVLKTAGFAALTELHGNIPYSQALNEEIRNPGLDTQEYIYTSLSSEIDSAIEDLEEAAEQGLATAGKQDILYKGDTKKWLALAYGIKARLLLDGAARFSENYRKALEFARKSLDAGFAGAELTVFNGVDVNNSWSAFFGSRHYSGACATVADLMSMRNDPRLPFYASDLFSSGVLYAEAGSYLASSIDNVGGPAWLKNPTASIHLLSIASLRFIIAECKSRLGEDPTADFQEGIRSSMKDYSESSKMELDANDVETYVASLGTPDLNEIMIQKYLSQTRDEQIETYNDMRRFIAEGGNYIVLRNPNNRDSGDSGQNRWPYSMPYGNSDVVSNPNVAEAFGTGKSAGYYIFTHPLWLFSK